MNDEFVYVIYIRTTPEKLWAALTTPELQRQFWFGMHQQTDWKAGGAWSLQHADGRVTDSGEVVEFDPPRRIVLKWKHEMRPELKEEGASRCEMLIEKEGELVRFTVSHRIDRSGSKLIQAVSGGWPRILSSLKSLLETGDSLPDARK